MTDKKFQVDLLFGVHHSHKEEKMSRNSEFYQSFTKQSQKKSVLREKPVKSYLVVTEC